MTFSEFILDPRTAMFCATITWLGYAAAVIRGRHNRPRLENVAHVTFIGITGIGYVFAGIYDVFALGEPYPFIRFNGYEGEASWCLAALCAIMFAGLRLQKAPDVVADSPLKWQRLRLPSLVFLLAAYGLALIFRTLAVGSDVLYVLPFRLNGVLEVAALVGLPLWLASAPRRSATIRVGQIAIIFVCVLNLTVFGSKWAALFPFLVFSVFSYVGGLRSLRALVTPVLAMAMLYTIVNPDVFADLISSESFTATERIVEAANQRGILAGDADESILLGLRNASVRVSGFVPMQWALYATDVHGVSGLSGADYVNSRILDSPDGNSWALGHVGFFILACGSSMLGVPSAAFAMLTIVGITRKLRRVSVPHFNGEAAALGFFLGTLVLLVDGRYNLLDYHLQLLFSMGMAAFVLVRAPGTTLGHGTPLRSCTTRSPRQARWRTSTLRPHNS